jgi:N-acetylglucosaminyldiphosphoundecaprenol N-acetyl-beta-D-mannosaminyltransferase
MRILNIRYKNVSFKVGLEIANEFLLHGKKASLFFLNFDSLRIALNDAQYSECLTKADLVLSDGIGLKLVTKLFGEEMLANCNGTDFSPRFLERVAEKGNTIFFLGGAEGVAEKAAANTKKQIPGIKIVGVHHGFFDNDDEMIERINKSGADILFVAMGVPKQEKWIAKNRDKLNSCLCLGVGALFDFLSMTIPRAPLFMRKLHLEWLWRIFTDPKRLFKRYIIDDIPFLLWLVLYRLKQIIFAKK